VSGGKPLERRDKLRRAVSLGLSMHTTRCRAPGVS